MRIMVARMVVEGVGEAGALVVYAGEDGEEADEDREGG